MFTFRSLAARGWRVLASATMVWCLAAAPAQGEDADVVAEPPAIGYTEPYRVITVSAAEMGILTQLTVQEGETVKKGQVLGQLDTAMLQAELDVARAEARLTSLRLSKVEELAGSSRATPDELERTRTEKAVKDAQVRKVEAQIEARTLRSPVDGIVTEIKRDLSEAVSSSQPHVLTVVEIDRLLVNLFLPPTIGAKMKAGDKAMLKLMDEGETPVPATVEFASPVIDAASGTIRVKFVINNHDGKHRAGGRCGLAE